LGCQAELLQLGVGLSGIDIDLRLGSLPVDLKSHDTTILVISGTTPFTTEEASFELEIR